MLFNTNQQSAAEKTRLFRQAADSLAASTPTIKFAIAPAALLSKLNGKACMATVYYKAGEVKHVHIVIVH